MALAERGEAPGARVTWRESGMSRRAFVEACRDGRIPGAVKVGKTWSVSSEDWSRFIDGLPRGRRVDAEGADVDQGDDDDELVAMLRELGHEEGGR